jgi:hypothetical protein
MSLKVAKNKQIGNTIRGDPDIHLPGEIAFGDPDLQFMI